MNQTVTKPTLYSKVLKVGTNHQGGSVEIEIEIKEADKGPELSICGSSWYRNGNDCYMCGQCLDSLPDEIKSWKVPRGKYSRIVQIWERWHLNDMNPGCVHQEEFKRNSKWGDFWNASNLDTIYKIPIFENCPDCGYRYGTTWKYESLPEDIIAEIKGW